MPAQKRRASATPQAEAPSSTRRRSTRISTSAATGTKSQYFESGDSDNDTEEDELSTPKKTNGVVKKAKTAPTATTSTKKRGRPRGRPAKKTAALPSDDDDDSEYGRNSSADLKTEENDQEDDGDLDEDEKPRVTFIPHVKMRDTSGVPYQDDRLHKNTLLFLKDLKANNKRSWLKCKSSFATVPFEKLVTSGRHEQRR